MAFNDISMMEIIPYELSLFEEAGGKTIVENTTPDLRGHINELKYFSVRNNINIIIGAGISYIVRCMFAFKIEFLFLS